VKRDDRYDPKHPRHHELMLTQVQRVRERLTTERTRARAHAQHAAEQAGLDEDTAAACVDEAMAAFDDMSGGQAWLPLDVAEKWDAQLALAIQRHAAP